MAHNTCVGDIIHNPYDRRSQKTSGLYVLPTCGIGIEIESEDAPFEWDTYKEALSMWQVTRDDSLRGAYPTECRFYQPYASYDIEVALAQYEAVLLQLDKPPVYSERTSVHVHLDVRDMTPKELHALLTIYSALEDVIFSYVEPSRKENIYCVPFNKNLYRLSLLRFPTRDSRIPRACECSHGKYTALNTECLGDKGSFEFRHLHGTGNSVVIRNWVNIIQSLKMAAMSEVDVMSPTLPLDVFGGYTRFLDTTLWNGTPEHIQLLTSYPQEGNKHNSVEFAGEYIDFEYAAASGGA